MAGLIAVAIDGSPAGHSALVLAARQAKLSSSAVVVLCSIEVGYSLAHAGSISAEDETEYPAAAHEEHALQEIIGNARDFLLARGVSATCERLVGRPAEQIVETAHRFGADMIVMGHRHLSWFDRMLHPSVCWDVLEHAECPVLVSMTTELQGSGAGDGLRGDT